MFTNLLAHCDRDGVADIHPRAIAEEVGLPIEQVRAALDVLESPDNESRSPAEEGRRIVRVDEHRMWGWRVVNYGKYRAIRNEDDRRKQNREAQARWREKSKQSKPASASGKADKPKQKQREKEKEKNKDQPPPPSGVAPLDPPPPPPPPPPAAPATDDKIKRPSKKCPQDFEVTVEMMAWAETNTPGIDAARETEVMRDHTFGVARSDWVGTWRNWMRKAHKDMPEKKSGAVVTKPAWLRDREQQVQKMTGRAPNAGEVVGEAVEVKRVGT